MRFEFQPSIQYYLAATAVIAVSLAIYSEPEISEPLPAPTLAGSQQVLQTLSSDGRPPASFALLGSLPFRLAVFMVGASTTVHVVASFLNLQRLSRLAFGALAPVGCALLWHLFGEDPRYFSITEILLFTIPFFAFGFVFVSFVFNLLFQPQTQQ